MAAPPIVPLPAPPDVPKLFYSRSLQTPRAIAWFGFRSFWGHLWHLAASVAATEDIDARDWMEPDDADDLTRRILRTLKPPDDPPPSNPEPLVPSASLTESLGRDVWLDFLADTGDDFAIGKVVGKMLAAEYEVADPDAKDGRTLHLPRGDILLFGGDTAYPVATDIEIHRRVIVPFNHALREAEDDKPRVLLGVPGNHDWYAGLDGFGRMFRRRRARLDRLSKDQRPGKTDDTVDRLGQIGHVFEYIEAFTLGKNVLKRAALALVGYEPVQSASYWAFRLAPKLDFWGLDRQLRAVDFAQRAFFAEQRDPDRAIVLSLADPIWAFLEPNPSGVDAVAAIDLDVQRDGALVLTGDTHHYCRQTFGQGMHVIAGGGGAFLHPACVARRGLPTPDAEFPGPKVTIALALQVPWQIVHGRSGFVVHFAIAAAYAPIFLSQWSSGTAATTACAVVGVVVALVCIGLGGWRHKALRIALLSIATGAAIGLFPLEVHEIVDFVGRLLHRPLGFFESALGAYLLSIYAGTLIMGTYLMLLTLLGLEQHQAMSALAHPGYKHFVRLRVKRDGSRIDGWVLGRVDPLAKDDEIVLVDRFTWKNPKM